MRQHTFLICLALIVTACGTKGQLVLPPGPATPPLLGNPAPATTSVAPTATVPAKPAVDDNNKAVDTKK